jgi:hypothetical protein
VVASTVTNQAHTIQFCPYANNTNTPTVVSDEFYETDNGDVVFTANLSEDTFYIILVDGYNYMYFYNLGYINGDYSTDIEYYLDMGTILMAEMRGTVNDYYAYWWNTELNWENLYALYVEEGESWSYWDGSY